MIEPRLIASFVIGAVVATGAATAGAALAGGGSTSGTVQACAVKKTGAMYLVGGRIKKCRSGDRAISWSSVDRLAPGIDGVQRIVSPSGDFSIAISDDGIVLDGPSGQVSIDRFRSDITDAFGKSKVK